MQIIIESVKSIHSAYDLWEKCKIRIDHPNSPRELGYKIYFEKNPDLFIGAYHQNKLIGLAILFFDGRKSSVYRMAVDPEYRRKGIGKSIILHIEKTAKKYGASSVYAMVEKSNINSQKLFNKLNYTAYDNLIYFTKDI